MKQSLLLITFLLGFFSSAQNPNLSQDAKISVLTIGPGKLLNDSFGHSAFRVQTGTLDIVYNYGMFDFEAPGFVFNFAKGKLDYFLGSRSYKDFIKSYIYQNRSIKEQVLNLTQEEKRAMFSFLINNAKTENKVYAYDFFYDNCATKMRDVTEKVLNRTIIYKTPNTYKPQTFRQLINNNIYWNSWGHFGINIALGSIIDRAVAPRDYMFLPEFVFQFFKTATFKNSGKSLIKETNSIYKATAQEQSNRFFLSPLFTFSVLAIFIIFITYKNYKNVSRSKWLDVVLFSILGVTGTILFLLWFATNHTATAYNYNMLWAFPICLIAIYQATKTIPKLWFIGFIKLLIIMLFLMLFHWVIGVQGFSFTLIPLLMALLIRYAYLIWFYKKKTILQKQ